MAKLAVRRLREGFQTGQIQANDGRMGVLPLLVRQKIPTVIQERIADPAARDAALARVGKVGDLLDTTIMPALKKAAESRDPDDIRTVLTLLDRFDKQLADLEKVVPPGPEDVRMHQTLVAATDLAVTKQCGAHMAEILKAMAIYTTTHRGRFPATLGDLYQEMISHPDASPATAAEAFLCPNDLKKMTLPAQPTAEWINRNTSYVYLGSAALTDNADPGAIILHEKLDAGHGKSVNAGYVDFHVMSLSRSKAEREIAESKEMLAPRTNDRPR